MKGRVKSKREAKVRERRNRETQTSCLTYLANKGHNQHEPERLDVRVRGHHDVHHRLHFEEDEPVGRPAQAEQKKEPGHDLGRFDDRPEEEHQVEHLVGAFPHVNEHLEAPADG